MANNKNIVKKLFDEVFSKGNIERCDDYCSASLKIHDPGLNHEFRGLNGFKEAERLYTKGFPGKQATIEGMYEDGDHVIVRWKCKGTHKGEFNGCSPTNHPVEVSGISIYRFENGKIAELWQTWDRLALYEQIGEIERKHALHH